MLLWTKSKMPLSLVIRAITGEDCSHFSFVFQSQNRNGLVFESNLLGTHPCFLKTSLKSHTIVHSIDVDLSAEEEDRIWDLVVDKYDGKPYDFGGVFYLGWRKILQRLFNVPLPKHNKWAKKNAYFCDEIYDVLNNISKFPKINVTRGMDTPHDVWMKLTKMEASNG